MSARPVLVDWFCGAGGAAMGYHRAGFDVIGVDVAPQPNYPFRFVRADALDLMAGIATGDVPEWYLPVVAWHLSPPCQDYSGTRKLHGRAYPRLIGPVRDFARWLGIPYVIENVPGAPLRDPVELCGAMFGLRTYRHRLFESNVPLRAPEHPAHVARTTKMGRRPRPGEFMHVIGNYSGAAEARAAMDIDWMNRTELAESIPPAYTEWIGARLAAALLPV